MIEKVDCEIEKKFLKLAIESPVCFEMWYPQKDGNIKHVIINKLKKRKQKRKKK